MWNYIGNGKNAFCGGRSKQPPAKMTLVLAVLLNDHQQKWHLCWQAAKVTASTDDICASGRLSDPPAQITLCWRCRGQPWGPLKQMEESRLKPAKNQSQTHLA
jgi:hypothetical protein